MATSYFSRRITTFALTLALCGHLIEAMDLCTYSSMFPNASNYSSSPTRSTFTDVAPPTPSTLERPLCPANMIYSNCSCEGTCELPSECTMNCSVSTCVCPQHDGFLMKDDKCVPREDCGCYVQDELVIPEGGLYVTANCSVRCECRENELECSTLNCGEYSSCDVKEGVRRCYCEEGYHEDGESCVNFKDCLDLFNANFTENGIYTIKPLNWPKTPFKVYCNMTDGGGWTVFQRRLDHSLNFYRNWSSYKEGFGYLDHEHWLGNDMLFYLTNQKDYQLRIDFVAPNGHASYAKYDLFSIADESDKYRRVDVGRYSKPSGRDNLLYHKRQAFSTYDRDHDKKVDSNCAAVHHSAWWFNKCIYCDLNAPVIHWGKLPGGPYNIKYTEMKLRPEA